MIKSIQVNGGRLRFITRNGSVGLMMYDLNYIAEPRGLAYTRLRKLIEKWPAPDGVGAGQRGNRTASVLPLVHLRGAREQLGMDQATVDYIISEVRAAHVDGEDLTKREVLDNTLEIQDNSDDAVEEWTVTIPVAAAEPRNALVQVDAGRTFDFAGIQLRVELDAQGEAWFQANDVCQALGYDNPRDALSKHVDAEDLVKRQVLSNGGKQLANFINESGLYALCLGSKLEGAKRFKRWVTSEVLPAIRKTGSYTAPAPTEAPLLSNENVLAMAKQLVSTTERLELVEAESAAKDASLTKGRQLYRQLKQEADSLRPDAESWRDRHVTVETLVEMAQRLGVSWWELAKALERRGCLYRLRNGKLVPSTHPQFRDFFDMESHGGDIGITAYGQRKLATMVRVAK